MKALGFIWRVAVGIKDFLVLMLLILFFVGISAAISQGRSVKVPDGGALVLGFNGPIVEQAAEVSPFDAASGNVASEVQARDVVRAIDRAAADARIKALVLELDGLAGAGQANITSINNAVQRFRKAGKPVHAWATSYADDGWLLAAGANRIWLNPLGGVLLAGPGGSAPYIAGLLNKLRIDINVFRVGTYKSFVEPFTRTAASPEAKAADQALANSLWTSWQAEGRRLRSRADVAAYVAQLPQRLGRFGGDGARAALDAGLVDELASRDQFEQAMAKLVGTGDPQPWGRYQGIGLDDYLSATKPASTGDAVGVVYVVGNIVDGEADRGTAGSATIRAALTQALADNPDIKALVVRVDSGGGSVTASEEIRAALLAAKADGLPVVTSFGPVAASGGYWVGTAGDVIMAQPATITGSIGVFAIIPSFGRALADVGITSDGVTTTPYSGQPDILAGLSPQVGQVLQQGVEDTYRRFLTIVGAARKLAPADVDKVGQGRVWSGAQAQPLKLVDQFGGLDEAVALAASKAGIKGAPRVIDIEKPEPPWAMALKGLTGAEAANPQGRGMFGRLVAQSQARLGIAARQLLALSSGEAATMQAVCVACTAAGTPQLPPRHALPGWLHNIVGLVQSPASGL